MSEPKRTPHRSVVATAYNRFAGSYSVEFAEFLDQCLADAGYEIRPLTATHPDDTPSATEGWPEPEKDRDA